MKSLLKIVLTIISGISAFFAFPTFLSLLARVFGPSIYPDYSLLPNGLVLLFAPCVVVPIVAYYAFTCRDVKRIETPKKTQVIIALTASLPTVIGAILIGTSFEGPISLLLWNTALLLNLFPFSTIVLLSLYYLLRGALAG